MRPDWSPGVSFPLHRLLSPAELRKAQTHLARVLALAGKNSDDIAAEAKSASWKIRGAHALRAEGTAPYAWIAEALNIGSPARFAFT